MTEYRFPIPSSLRGERLRGEVAAVTGEPVGVSVGGGQLIITVPDGTQQSVVSTVLAAHSGAPTPAEVAEAQADAEASTVFGDFTQAQMTKIRAVYADPTTSAFTKQQSDKLLAGLALLVHRRLR